MSGNREYEELKALINDCHLKLECDFTEHCVREALADITAKATQIETLLQSMPSLRSYEFSFLFKDIADYVKKIEELITEWKVSKFKRL